MAFGTELGSKDTMKIYAAAPILDDILECWHAELGADLLAYTNHCYRVLNFCLALVGDATEIMKKLSIATAFHDIGIWTDNTYDYLQASRQHAREYLAKINQDAWCEEIETMIEQHHKITKYKAYPDWLVEPFRKADWIDVLRGKITFGIPAAFVTEVMERFPNAGFHRRLVSLTAQRLKSHPLSPLPMLRL